MFISGFTNENSGLSSRTTFVRLDTNADEKAGRW